MSTAVKLIAAFVLTVVALVAAGVSGFTFYVWPTTLGDYSLVVTPQMIAELSKLRQERKFVVDKENFYFGAPSEVARTSAQNAVDAVIDSLIKDLPKNPKRSVVLTHFKLALQKFDTPESEERDQFLVYLQRIMLIVGVNGSGELLNVWRYGFPYDWVRRA